MMNDEPGTTPDEERLLVLAPTPLDARICCETLSRSGIACLACADLAELCGHLETGAGAGAALIPEEAFAGEEAPRLLEWLRAQPAWSDLPLLFLTLSGADSRAARQAMETLGNVLLMERPLRRATLVSAARMALRERGRQYLTRSHLEQLRSAREAAEDANRAKSEFLANMSHEIRTPMTVFMSAVEHLLEIDRHPERRRLLGMAEKSSRRLRSLIDDILDFSRIEARQVELEEEPYELRACVRDAVEMFDLSAREKGLVLEADAAEETPVFVIGDPDRVGQVLINLVGNAVKFTHEGSIRVYVRPRDGLLEFSVSDTGIGIPPEKRELLFKSFTQMDGSFTRRYGGTGLGLAISRGLVELMGGRIEVQSRAEQGSVFTFTLPLKTPGGETSSPEASLSEASGEDAPVVRILLAEDDPMIQEVIIMMLKSRGWQTETVGCGRDAIRKWQEESFDLVLMDLQMPGTDGIEATRTIRAREAAGRERVCIIGLTAHARRKTRDECLRAGMDEVLTKPVGMDDLHDVLERCLAEKHGKT